MKPLLIAYLICVGFSAAAQKESKISISCYVNPELYLQAGVVTYISNESGNFSCKGKFITIYNKSKNIFQYKSKNDWKSVKPSEQVIIVRTANSTGTDNVSIAQLNVKYIKDKETNIALKMQFISTMNAQSDKVKAKELGQITSKPKINTSSSKKVIAKMNKPSVKKEKLEINKKEEVKKANNEKTPENNNRNFEGDGNLLYTIDRPIDKCYFTSDTAYFTFYYQTIRDTIFFSNPFAVERYDNEEAGSKILSSAWGCLSSRIIEQFGEDKYNELLNDVDNDLITGFQHIRNPHIPSGTIIKEYPYTQLKSTAEKELQTWIKDEISRNPKMRLVKLNFP